MGDAFFQSDLDALFGNGAPAKDEGGTLAQSDLDALFGDMAPKAGVNGEDAHVADDLEGLDLSQLGRETQPHAGAGPAPGSETLSQDDIDALLKEFLG